MHLTKGNYDYEQVNIREMYISNDKDSEIEEIKVGWYSYDKTCLSPTHYHWIPVILSQPDTHLLNDE